MPHNAAEDVRGLFFGLASASSWGAGDFGGGLATQRGNVTGVVVVSQAVGLVLLAGLALLLAEPLPSLRDLLLGAAAGLAGGLGLLAFYQSLSQGHMGVAGPLAAVVSAGLPVIYGAVREGLPGGLQLAGFGLTLAAIWLLSQGSSPMRLRVRQLGLSLLAGLGFGLFLILIDRGGERAVLWPLVAARLTSVALLAPIALRGRCGALPARRELALVGLVGLFDSGGNAFYALAAQTGRLDVAATLGSLYPVNTILLARLILKERLAPRQWLGAAVALITVLLIAV